MKKPELRKLFLEKRAALSEAEYGQRNRLIGERFFATVDLSFIKTVHTFLPIRDRREVDTWLIVERIRREFPGVRLSLPKMDADGSMQNIYFEGVHQLVRNTWGIDEPRHGVPTPVSKIDLVLVPLLCADKKGNRIGYGKGYYDRMLSQCRPDCAKIGLSLFEPIDEIADLESSDVPLTMLVTPKAAFTFSQGHVA